VICQSELIRSEFVYKSNTWYFPCRDRPHQDWSDDQQTFDKVYSQTMDMADALADGIIKQFPTRV